jgi:hypothetical protein
MGLSLAALDGSRIINILAFPLIGLIAWNGVVYILLLLAWMRSGRSQATGLFWFSALYERWIRNRFETLLKQFTRFNVPLSTALRRFAADWNTLSRPLLWLRAKRLLHTAAALVALGMIVGLYVRGVVLRYEAGWESTFLGPESAHALISALYGPASALSGIALPSVQQIGVLRWTGSGGGGEAARWIHLIALTAAFYIVLPRLGAALLAQLRLWRFAHRPPLPPALVGYARALVMSVGDGDVRDVATVIPYSYQPQSGSVTGLELLLTATLGANLTVQTREPVRYGDEDTVLGVLAPEHPVPVDTAEHHPLPAETAVVTETAHATRSMPTASAPSAVTERTASSRPKTLQEAATGDWIVLLMTLAATPEIENHGALIRDLRDALTRSAKPSPLLVIVDEAPFSARLFGAGFEQRLQERRTLWREFVAGHGLSACIVDLTQIRAGSPYELQARDAARAALWTPSER